MLFNSLEFLYFFLIVTTLFYLIPHRGQWLLLLMASCYFYMAFLPIYILILGFTIVIDYIAGIQIEASTGHRRKLFLILSLVANIGVLAFFKYYNFVNNNLSAVLETIGYHNPVPALLLLLPIGLSFHTFQAMSYTIEVYRGKYKAERHFGIYALYVMFYPQLVAGPIERPQNILWQFFKRHEFDYHNVVTGLKIILWGLFKKIVIGDRLGSFVDQVYNDPTNFHGLALIVATVFFALQIYCDFSGYSDIAVGTARGMGFELIQNFNRPYFSRSISEFWRRWHISLSSWFRDYLYIPLGGNRVKLPRRYFNLMLTFLISGLWHGANWTFIIWGGLNGLFQMLEIASDKFRGRMFGVLSARYSKTMAACGILFTFILICFTWIFFRANTLHDAFYIVSNIFAKGKTSIYVLFNAKNYVDVGFGLFGLFILLFFEVRQGAQTLPDYLSSKPKVVNWGFYYGLVMAIFLLGDFWGTQQFIYFQF